MISIGGDFVKLLLLLPLILCANEGLKKLSEEENEKVLEKCGKFNELKNGVSIMKFDEKEHLVSWVSSHHFLVDASILPKEFDEDTCKKKEKQVLYQSKDTKTITNFHGLFLGNCEDVGVGMVLMESSEVRKHWLCIQNDTSNVGNKVKVVENPEAIHQANVVGCNQNHSTIMCLEAVKSHHGHVIFGAKGSWSIGGYVINAQNVKQIKAWNLDDHRAEICDFSGICNNVVYIPKNPTTEVITTEATITNKPENDTTLTSETSPNPETIPTAETIAIPVADNTTEVSITTEKQSTEATTEVSKAMQPETTQESSITEKPTDIPTASRADNNQTIPVNQSTKDPSNPSDAPSTDVTPITQPTVPDVGTSRAPKDTASTVITEITSTNLPIGSKPHAQPLKTEEIVEEVIDCEEENLCFSEDFFSSSNHFNTLSLISSVLVLIFL